MNLRLENLSDDPGTAKKQADELVRAALHFREHYSAEAGFGRRNLVVYGHRPGQPKVRSFVYQTKGGTIVAQLGAE